MLQLTMETIGAAAEELRGAPKDAEDGQVLGIYADGSRSARIRATCIRNVKGRTVVRQREKMQKLDSTIRM
jgi:hypothetical protein